ncbi:MAG: D-alanine--D-alanine ligase [Rubrobacter sp.]|nr:D-alanine--D-alanine ligase [Rubrobacter sp.]
MGSIVREVFALKIAVLMGGTSTERDVSLSSGTAVATALRSSGHSVSEIDTALTLEYPEKSFFGKDGANETSVGVARKPPTLSELKEMEGKLRGHVFAPGILEACRMADIAFIALHGGFGEDGRIQAALEMAAIPHTGTSYLGCALAFNKDVSKRVMRSSGIATPEWREVRDTETKVSEIEVPFGFPRIVKPAKGGSTLGVSLVENESEFEDVVRETLEYGEVVLIEEFIEGREFTVGVLGEDALPVIEIQTSGKVFDYESKYQPGEAKEICPAPIPDDLAEKLQKLALATHESLKVGRDAYSRVDFRVSAGGEPFCLEANVLPGMTPNSLLPLAASTAGIPFPELCERISGMVAPRG